ncbi:MAG TPA: HAMP domain-containing sensor histidine kinase [Thermoanaerobaculia bacterium]|nr:HAMP domain-containing sensor histidine kinase [Thermoanaerobaculia bacterium]
MAKQRSIRLVVTYVLSLAATITLLVVWVVYVVQARSEVSFLGNRLVDWPVLTLGCVLLALLIGGLTYQLAGALAARRYSQKQEEFVSHVTHELKSPLAAIKLHAQTLENPGLSPAQRGRSVGYILTEAERMSRLVDNVLESSRLLARRRALPLEPVDLAAFFRHYLPLARSRVESHGLKLRWLGETRARVRATEDALERVLTNLLDNAVRFSDKGGEVRCSLADVEQRVVITVEDDGIGIPKAELGKIFDRFYQIGREIKGRRRGSGLGLSIVSGLVREMKGTVRAFSHEGRPGTRLVVELPRVEVSR